MEILIRDVNPEDTNQLLDVFRSAHESLRKSKGGQHPDKAIDDMISLPDERLAEIVTKDNALIVAEVRETGELAGMGAVTNRWYDFALGSTYSKNHFVKTNFQRGKAGVSVGKLLRKASIEKARSQGFRKLYGYSTPEAQGFHKKFGAVFLPEFNSNYLRHTVPLHYYEIKLKKSILNSMYLEPYIYELTMLISNAGHFINHHLKRE